MKRLLQATVLLVLLVNVLSTLFILHETNKTLQAATAQATSPGEGVVAFCLNQQPTITVPCAPNMTEHSPYTCQLNGSDPEGRNLSFFQTPQPPDNLTTQVFNVTPSGLINFTPNESDVGNHSTLFGVDDHSGCDNAHTYALFNFSVANVNDPPYLVRPIPNQTLYANTTLYAFYLRDYFTDPDIPWGDHLTFTLIQSTATVPVNATIKPDSSVVFSGSQCGKAYFIFRATDTGNLFADSNVVEVEVSCGQQQSGGNQQGNGGAGAGAGGGGEALTCKPELVCLPWSDCYPNGLQIQTCKDKNGCSDTEIRFYQNCTYAGEQPLCLENWLCTDWSVCSLAGKQNRTCDDLRECHTTRFRPLLEQECVYTPRCDDGVQNGNETGVDCGGDCPP